MQELLASQRRRPWKQTDGCTKIQERRGSFLSELRVAEYARTVLREDIALARGFSSNATLPTGFVGSSEEHLADIGAVAVRLCKKGLFSQASLSGVHYSLSGGCAKATLWPHLHNRVILKRIRFVALRDRSVRRRSRMKGNKTAMAIIDEVHRAGPDLTAVNDSPLPTCTATMRAIQAAEFLESVSFL